MKTTHKTLGDLAEIHSGYLFREGYIPDAESKHRAIQAKDIDVQTRTFLVPDFCVQVQATPQPQHYIKENDILFLSKMNPMAIFVERTQPNLIASSYFFIIREKGEEILPTYLAWYLNQKPAQTYFRSVGQGSTILNVTKRDLMTLPIPIPHPALQEKIAHLDSLAREYRREHEVLQDKMTKLISLVSEKSLKKAERTLEL
jgi:hypothetical protein